LQRAIAIRLEADWKCGLRYLVGDRDVFLVLFGAVKVFANMKRLEVIHELVNEFCNRYFRQVPVRFVSNEPHRKNITQRGCDKVRILANQQFQPSCKILIGTHGSMKREIDLNVTPSVYLAICAAASRTVKLGGTVATVGFPDIGLQGFAPKLAKGEIASLAGAADDPRYFQISLPVQPGNSGGALVDARGNVVGIVAAKLDASAALAATGSLPENVNYAVKSSLLLSFLESVPAVDAKLKAPNTKDEAFEDVVKSAQEAAVLVLVY
jgi:hypothetical protein